MAIGFHGLLSVATAGAGPFYNNVPLSPTGFNSFGLTRLLAEADPWAHFRFRELKFRLYPQSGTNASVGWLGGYQDNLPTSIASVMELGPSVLTLQACTQPTDWCVVPKADLAGPFPWYKTVPGTADPTEEQPGFLMVVGAANYTANIEVRGVIEYKTAVVATATPMEMELRKKIVAVRQAAAREKVSNSALSATAAALSSLVVGKQGATP